MTMDWSPHDLISLATLLETVSNARNGSYRTPNSKSTVIDQMKTNLLQTARGGPKATKTCMARRPNKEADARSSKVANTIEDPCEIQIDA